MVNNESNSNLFKRREAIERAESDVGERRKENIEHIHKPTSKTAKRQAKQLAAIHHKTINLLGGASAVLKQQEEPQEGNL